MAGWAAWSPVRERDKLGVVTYNYQVINTSTRKLSMKVCNRWPWTCTCKHSLETSCTFSRRPTTGTWHALLATPGSGGSSPRALLWCARRTVWAAEQLCRRAQPCSGSGEGCSGSTSAVKEIIIIICLRDIYVKRDTKIFNSVQQFADIINEQIGIRASLICGKLPAEEVSLSFFRRSSELVSCSPHRSVT